MRITLKGDFDVTFELEYLDLVPESYFEGPIWVFSNVAKRMTEELLRFQKKHE